MPEDKNASTGLSPSATQALQEHLARKQAEAQASKIAPEFEREPEKAERSKRPHLVPSVIAALMLLAAMGSWPYGYYLMLRWVVCAAAVFVAYQGWRLKRSWAAWGFGFLAALFNPLVPVHLNRPAWRVIDLAAAVAFIAGIIFVVERKGGAATDRDKHGEEA